MATDSTGTATPDLHIDRRRRIGMVVLCWLFVSRLVTDIAGIGRLDNTAKAER